MVSILTGKICPVFSTGPIPATGSVRCSIPELPGNAGQSSGDLMQPLKFPAVFNSSHTFRNITGFVNDRA